MDSRRIPVLGVRARVPGDEIPHRCTCRAAAASDSRIRLGRRRPRRQPGRATLRRIPPAGLRSSTWSEASAWWYHNGTPHTDGLIGQCNSARRCTTPLVHVTRKASHRPRGFPRSDRDARGLGAPERDLAVGNSGSSSASWYSRDSPSRSSRAVIPNLSTSLQSSDASTTSRRRRSAPRRAVDLLGLRVSSGPPSSAKSLAIGDRMPSASGG